MTDQRMTAEYFALGRKLLGLKPPPPEPRHFLPAVVGEFVPAGPRPGVRGLMFDGYDDANSARYLLGDSKGSCLEPDLPGCWMVAIDPRLPVRDGDIGLVTIRVHGIKYEGLKHVQTRDGCLWACSNDGDFPLSARAQLGGRLVFALVPKAQSVTYSQGLANLFAALHDANIKEPLTMGPLSKSLVDLFLPMTSGVLRAGARALDPYQREVYGMLDEIKSRIPGLSKTLPPRRDLWGNPVTQPFGSSLSPTAISPVHHSPIDDEIIRQGWNINMPEAKQTFRTPQGHASINMRDYPEAYSRLLELAGHELKAPQFGGLGLKELLDSIVSGTHPLSAVYQRMDDGESNDQGSKRQFVESLIHEYRTEAKRQLLEEYPALRQDVSDKAEAMQALKMGGAGQ
jgi:hypothetical protein